MLVRLRQDFKNNQTVFDDGFLSLNIYSHNKEKQVKVETILLQPPYMNVHIVNGKRLVSHRVSFSDAYTDQFCDKVMVTVLGMFR